MRNRVLSVAAFIVVAGAVPALAGTLSVAPVRVSLPTDGRPEIVRLRNRADTPTLVQIAAVHWAEPEQLDAAPRAGEVLAVPPIFELGPDQEQVIRLALRRPLEGSTEQAYRLLITEVPRDVSVDENRLVFAVRLNLPLFVTPAGATAEPVWSLRRSKDGEAELVLANHGRAHLRIGSLELSGAGDSNPLFASDQLLYALAGEEISWRIGKSLDSLPKSLEVQAETQLGQQRAALNWTP